MRRRIASIIADAACKGVKGPFRLRTWKKQIVGALLPGSGPRPRQALLSLPRGNGKTSLAAVLGAYGLYADGVESAEVVVVASDARQAGITLRQISRMVELETRLAEQTQVFQSRLYVPHTDSTLCDRRRAACSKCARPKRPRRPPHSPLAPRMPVVAASASLPWRRGEL
jgi:phage terminase large subunit-like protein